MENESDTSSAPTATIKVQSVFIWRSTSKRCIRIQRRRFRPHAQEGSNPLPMHLVPIQNSEQAILWWSPNASSQKIRSSMSPVFLYFKRSRLARPSPQKSSSSPGIHIVLYTIFVQDLNILIYRRNLDRKISHFFNVPSASTPLVTLQIWKCMKNVIIGMRNSSVVGVITLPSTNTSLPSTCIVTIGVHSPRKTRGKQSSSIRGHQRYAYYQSDLLFKFLNHVNSIDKG